jgi:hypothetical protein
MQDIINPSLENSKQTKVESPVNIDSGEGMKFFDRMDKSGERITEENEPDNSTDNSRVVCTERTIKFEHNELVEKRRLTERSLNFKSPMESDTHSNSE